MPSAFSVLKIAFDVVYLVGKSYRLKKNINVYARRTNNLSRAKSPATATRMRNRATREYFDAFRRLCRASGSVGRRHKDRGFFLVKTKAQRPIGGLFPSKVTFWHRSTPHNKTGVDRIVRPGINRRGLGDESADTLRCVKVQDRRSARPTNGPRSNSNVVVFFFRSVKSEKPKGGGGRALRAIRRALRLPSDPSRCHYLGSVARRPLFIFGRLTFGGGDGCRGAAVAV